MEKIVFEVADQPEVTRAVNALLDTAKELKISVSTFYRATQIANKMLEEAARETAVDGLDVQAVDLQTLSSVD